MTLENQKEQQYFAFLLLFPIHSCSLFPWVPGSQTRELKMTTSHYTLGVEGHSQCSW